MSRGRLRIYLGAAPGVGKTFAMLNEGRRRLERGTDVVVGFVETHGRANTAAQMADLEVVPRRRITYRGAEFEEMDVDAVIARRPQVALVDELAHTNVPGSSNEKRWEDVEEILDAGIDVISTLNIQHLESVNDVVERITGIEQQETVPDAIVRAAEQVEIVDMTPEALRRRMAHGNVYPAERIDAALGNYFRPGNLAALRELALLWVADKVDESLQQYMEDHGIEATWETRERVVAAITGAPGGDDLIRRAARMAYRHRGDLIGVHVRSSDGLAEPSSDRLEEYRHLIAELGGSYHEVVADDAGRALVQFARAEHATQIVMGATRRSRWSELVRGSVISDVLRHAGRIDVHVISQTGSDEEPAPRPAARPRLILGPSRRRRAIAWLVAGIGLPVLTVAMVPFREDLGLAAELLVYLLLTVAVAAVGGLLPALATAVAGFLLGNWFFTPPIHTLTIAEPENLLALVAFLVVALVVGSLVTVAARRAAEATQARSDAETLARLSGELVAHQDPLPGLMAELRATFGAEAIAVLTRSADGWSVETAVGEPVPQRPEAGQLSVPLGRDSVLVVVGSGLDERDLGLLRAFTSQLALAIERRHLQAEAAVASNLAEANELRTALLAAVSHDLRTPLASIKASVTSLLQRDVDWTPEARRELLETIAEETDRLNGLVGNLLDMSRLSTGAVELVYQDVGLEEIVGRALRGLPHAEGRVTLDVPETLAHVRADAALLERAVANVVGNALAWSPPEIPVRVEAGEVGKEVHLLIADRGPGVPAHLREAIFQPFQRLGDRSNGAGVGLGLAVARGFVEAMGGELHAEDTPGGGLTMVLSLQEGAR